MLRTLAADADEADRMMADFMAAATSTPVEVVKPAEQVTAETVKPAEDVKANPVGPAKPYSADEMPSVALIEAAAVAFDLAADASRRAEQTKRKARKTLDRVPSGRFGRASVSWEQSSRQTPDLEKIAALLKTIGVDEIPCATARQRCG